MNQKLKNILGFVFFMGVMAMTFSVVFKDQSIGSLFTVLKQVDFKYIVAGSVLMFLFIASDALKLLVSLKGLNQKTTFLKTLGYAFIGFYFSSITPSATGGQPAQIYYMKKDKIDFSESSLTLLLTTITYQIGTILFAGMMYLFNYKFISSQLGAMKLLLMISVVINSIGILIMIALMFSPQFVKQLILPIMNLLHKLNIIKDINQAVKKLEKQVTQYQEGAAYIKSHPLLVMKIIGITFFQLIALYLIPYLVYKSFNLQGYSAFDMIAMQSLLTLAISAIPLPGAMGVSETGFMSMFRLFFASHLLVPAMLLSRLVSFYGILVLSGIITIGVHLYKAKQTQLVFSQTETV